MTTATPEPTEAAPSRAGRFYGAAAFALAVAIFIGVAGGAVAPLTSLWASGDSPPAASPAEPGAPAEPGVAAPEPEVPVNTDVCATGSEPFTARVCAAASGLGWTVTSASAELAPGTSFTALDGSAQSPLAPGEAFEITSLTERSTLTFAHQADGVMSAEVVGLPAQSDASLAKDIRTTLGQSEVWFFDGMYIVDGPNPMSFGEGWTVATAHDPARTVGEVVTVGWVTLTVTQTDSSVGTLYAVATAGF